MIEVTKIAIPFAKSGNKSVIYDTRQQGQAENEATWETGFPPVTMIRKEDGGLPPTGLDFNGIFHDISSNVVFACMGGQYKFDAEYANEIGGYPKGAILLNNQENMQYISNVDNNKVNFNTANASTLTAWSIISIADIDKLLAQKIDNADFSSALNQKANVSTNINAGNGLTGGGDLTTSRTLSLGTPSTISQNSKNNVTTSSHTHEIAKATTSQAGIVQLTDVLGTSTSLVATQKLVNDTKINLDNSVRAVDIKADNAQSRADSAYNLADRKRDVDDIIFTKPNYSALILRNSDVQGIGAYMHILNDNGRGLQLAYRDDKNSPDGQTVINLPTQGGNIPVINQTSAIGSTQYTAWEKAITLPGVTALMSIYESSSVTQVLKLIPSNSLFESLEARGSGEDIEHRARYRRIIRTGN